MKNLKKTLEIIALLFLVGTGTANAQQGAEGPNFSFLYNSIKTESDASRMEALVIKMANNKLSANQQELLTYSQGHLADTYAAEGNTEKVNYWLGHLKSPVWKESVSLSCAQELTHAGKLKEAEALLKPYLTSAAVFPAKGGTMDLVSPTPRSEFYAAYGTVLFKQKDYNKALGYLMPPDTALQVNSASVKEFYALALIGAGLNEKAEAEVKSVIALNGDRSDYFKTEAANYYQNRYGSTAQLDKMLSAAAVKRKSQAAKKVSAYSTDEVAPNFEVTDVNGRKVSLSSLKGKTVIIDFWATWCIPCVGSFPGMQKAVNYYARDTSVVFMFIHTAEVSPSATAEAKRLLKNRHFNFDLYMDLKDPASKKNPLMAAFRVTGLPTKFVINKKGVIKFKSTGYVSEEDAIDEISSMVELANQ